MTVHQWVVTDPSMPRKILVKEAPKPTDRYNNTWDDAEYVETVFEDIPGVDQNGEPLSVDKDGRPRGRLLVRIDDSTEQGQWYLEMLQERLAGRDRRTGRPYITFLQPFREAARLMSEAEIEAIVQRRLSEVANTEGVDTPAQAIAKMDAEQAQALVDELMALPGAREVIDAQPEPPKPANPLCKQCGRAIAKSGLRIHYATKHPEHMLELKTMGV